jgi:hypothetical protein
VAWQLAGGGLQLAGARGQLGAELGLAVAAACRFASSSPSSSPTRSECLAILPLQVRLAGGLGPGRGRPGSAPAAGRWRSARRRAARRPRRSRPWPCSRRRVGASRSCSLWALAASSSA